MKSLLVSILTVLAAAPVFAQDSAFPQGEAPRIVLKVLPHETISAKIGSSLKVALSLQVDEGYHVNSNTPADSFLIPLRLTWSAGPLESGTVSFPKPEFEKLSFSEKAVSVFKGAFELDTKFKVPSGAIPGQATIAGKLHYQACNDRMCLPPRTLEVNVSVEIVK